jgi:hypothetical protein
MLALAPRIFKTQDKTVYVLPEGLDLDESATRRQFREG